ncbi:MAG: choice-of-anchor B family protein [Planctomycetota bacterium]
MRLPAFHLLLSGAFFLSLPPATAAHEDDPKILHRKPPVQSVGYRTGTWGRGGGIELSASGTFQAQNVTLLSWLPLGDFGSPQSGNDCWGYTSGSGREYALFGSSDGLHVVEVTNPGDPSIIGFVDGPNSLWRDVKVYGTRAYVVSEGGSGIQIVNLANVDAGQIVLENTVTTGGVNSSHNVALDTDSGFLYRCGGGSNGLRMYSLANPASPSFAGSWSDRYVHDAQIKTFTSGPYAGRQIAFCCSGFNGGGTDTGISIVDVTIKSNPVHRGQISWPGARYSHQAWLSEDGLTLFVNDELDEGGPIKTTTYVIDVSDIDNPVYEGSFTNDNPAIGHNLYVEGDLLYEANYRSGLRVFDVSDPLNAFETAWFDTDPAGDGATFNGMWSNYPYFSGELVIGSDLERGLFMMWVGTPLVQIEIPGGAPDVLSPAGDGFNVVLNELNPGDYAPGTAQLHYDDGNGMVSVPLSDLGGNTFSASIPGFACGTDLSYYVSADSTSGVTWVSPPNGGMYEAVVADAAPVIFVDDFETDQGWTAGAPGDTATNGLWVRDDPNGTPAQPEDDTTLAGTQCFFTGQGTEGGLIIEADVNDGPTTLISPVLDLEGLLDPRISYMRWYSNVKGLNPGMDTFKVGVSDDGGANWTNVEVIGPDGEGTFGGWFEHSFNVTDFVEATDSVRVRFIASDNGAPSIVEAAIDDFEVIAIECPDCNGNGVTDSLDIAAGTSLDLDGEGTPDECQPFSADTGELSASAGGTAQFTLNGGDALASELYLVLGSLTGTEPGFNVGAVHVPLIQDVYYGYSLAHANTPPLVGTFGILDGLGQGSAQFQLAPGFSNLVSLQAHHAWIGIDPVSLAVTFASNALPLSFLP